MAILTNSSHQRYIDPQLLVMIIRLLSADSGLNGTVHPVGR
jgi:hypothetical protein